MKAIFVTAALLGFIFVPTANASASFGKSQKEVYAELRAEGETTLYDELGGERAIRAVNDHMMSLSLSDPEMAVIFKDTNITRLKELLYIHTCHKADGPCDYDGQDMRRAHDGLNIRTKHFNKLVENMQAAMDAEGIPFRVQNRLMARLAFYHDDVTGRSPIPPRNKSKPKSYPALPVSLSENSEKPASSQNNPTVGE